MRFSEHVVHQVHEVQEVHVVMSLISMRGQTHLFVGRQ